MCTRILTALALTIVLAISASGQITSQNPYDISLEESLRNNSTNYGNFQGHYTPPKTENYSDTSYEALMAGVDELLKSLDSIPEPEPREVTYSDTMTINTTAVEPEPVTHITYNSRPHIIHSKIDSTYDGLKACREDKKKRMESRKNRKKTKVMTPTKKRKEKKRLTTEMTIRSLPTEQ